MPAGRGKSPVVETTVTFDKVDQEIHIPGSVKPDSVVVDPDHDLLMENKSAGPVDAELAAQLKYAPSYQDRVRAARRLATGDKGKDDATVQLLTEALSAESSDMAASALISLLADTKKESLRPLFRAQAASKSPARRTAAFAALGALPKTAEDLAVLRKTAMSDTEPYADVEAALRAVSRLDVAGNLDVFQHQIVSHSTRERLANTVVSLLSDAKLDAGVPVLLQAAAAGRKPFLRRSAIRAIGTMAPDNQDVHTALVAASKSDGETFVQMAAIDALKNRKDIAALDTLRDLAANAKDSTVRSMAQDAVTDLSSK